MLIWTPGVPLHRHALSYPRSVLPTFFHTKPSITNNFALSIWETISEYKANANRPKALGWPLLKIYYSGFFAGHALMRAVGQAIVRVEPRQAKRLTEIGQLFCGNSFSVSPGNYELRTEQASDRYCQLDAGSAQLPQALPSSQSRSAYEGSPGRIAPRNESAIAGHAILTGRKTMTAELEVVVDRSVSGEKLLRMPD